MIYTYTKLYTGLFVISIKFEGNYKYQELKIFLISNLQKSAIRIYATMETDIKIIFSYENLCMQK
jgi:hypothetical protein